MDKYETRIIRISNLHHSRKEVALSSGRPEFPARALKMPTPLARSLIFFFTSLRNISWYKNMKFEVA